MQTKIFAMIIAVLSLVTFTGCDPINNSAQSLQANQQSSIAKRFETPQEEAKSAVQSAVEISQKYTELAEQTAQLKQAKTDLEKENLELKTQVTALQKELEQTQKELTEANDMMLEMRVELNNWKNNVLGFRDEMMQAEKAELELSCKFSTLWEVKFSRTQNSARSN